jgi:hypothetical protein
MGSVTKKIWLITSTVKTERGCNNMVRFNICANHILWNHIPVTEIGALSENCLRILKVSFVSWKVTYWLSHLVECVLRILKAVISISSLSACPGCRLLQSVRAHTHTQPFRTARFRQYSQSSLWCSVLLTFLLRDYSSWRTFAASWGFLTRNILWGGVITTPKPQTWRTSGLDSAWLLHFDLSGLGDPARSLRISC